MDAKVFMEGLEEIEKQKGIKKESVIQALSEAIRKAYIKYIGGEDDADVRVTINEKEIKMSIVKEVMEDAVVDYLEITPKDAKKYKKDAKVGDFVEIDVPVEDLARITAVTAKSVLKQKLAEAEKQVLYETNKDKVNEMISGVVETCDERGASVTVGRTSVYLSRRDLIGDEMFKPGDTIRMFVSDVSQTGKGSMIKVSRSDAGYLKRLFEEEVSDIYNGTVIIKNLVREAGIRAKLAVYSNDFNVDCVASCIGVNGYSIKKIVDQLGNTREKEKIDIIQYSPNDALFIIEALRPATVVSLHIFEPDEDGKKKAIAIVPDDQLSLAIGKKGANARLACKLTGYSIDIKEERELPNYADLTFKSVEEIKEEEKQRVKADTYERYLAQVKAARAQEEANNTPVEGGVVKSKPQQILDSDLKEETKVEVKPVEEVKEEVKVETPVEQPKVVKTTTTLESLEKALEEDKKKEAFKATQKTSKRPHTITEKEVEREVASEVKPEKKLPQMDIYTKEELEDIEANDEYLEEEYYDDEDIDYDEYDKYYDDDDN